MVRITPTAAAIAIAAATLLSVHPAEARADDRLPHWTDPSHGYIWAPQTRANPWRTGQWMGPWVDSWTGRFGH
jgi:ABC-type sugar transport system substrate-binding protein